MNIHPSAAAAAAGSARAAAKGGEHDNQVSQSQNRQQTQDAPGGKPADSSAVDAGDETGDRGGNGKQVLDVFEKSQENEELPSDDESSNGPLRRPSEDGSGTHLDLEA